MKSGKLTVHAVRSARDGRHGDGAGLYLDVAPSGAKRWTLITAVRGKRTEIGLGSVELVTLAAARNEAQRLRGIARAGGDPLAERRAERGARLSFGEYADTLFASIEVGFQNQKHRDQWRHSLTVHCASIRALPVADINTDDVLGVLQPLWSKHPETASRLRGRIERVLDAARAKGIRSNENPARWRGHLDKLLPAPRKLTRGHHAAMPWRGVPAFYAALSSREAVSALMFRFLILTAARSGEVRGALWSEIDQNNAIWTVPASRMKARKEHRVPLNTEALTILEKAKGLSAELIFPSSRGKPFSDMCFKQLMTRMRVTGVTAHGFRSSFRDWASEEAHADWHVAEACLAHSVGSAVERAYARSDLFERRRGLLGEWSSFLSARETCAFPRSKR